jgi:predicted Ser/Thr protein kinase
MRAVMTQPGMSEKISRATVAAMADPELRRRLVEALKQRFFDNPELRSVISQETKRGMERWRETQMKAARILAQQLSKEQRAQLVVELGSVGSGKKSALNG